MASVGRLRSKAETCTRPHQEPGSSPYLDEDGPASSSVRDSARRGGQSVLSPIAAAILACVLVVGCGSKTPTSPDPDPLPLHPGLQLLTLGGFALSNDPAFPPCVPIGQPREGTSVSTTIMLSNDGGTWIARSVSDGDTLELRLHSAGQSPSGLVVAGTLSGSAADQGVNGFTRDVRITLLAAAGAGPATVEGSFVWTGSSFVTGRITGALRFSDSHDMSSTYSAIQWSMQPY